jgi:hypothetical protein
MLPLVEGNTPLNTRDIETNSSILGPDNTNSSSSPTSNEALIVVKVESNTPFNTWDIETNSSILGPDNTNSPLSPKLNEALIVVKGID